MNSHNDKEDIATRRVELLQITQKKEASIDNFLELAELYYYDQEYKKVIDITERALSIVNKNDDKAAIFYNMALGHYGLQDYQEATKCFLKSLDVAALLDDSYFKIEIMGANHYYLRWCFYNEKEKFEEHAQKAKDFYEALVNKYPDADTVNIAYEYLGYLYIDFADFNKATEYFNKALDKTISNEHRQSCYLGISECLKQLGDRLGSDKYSKMAAQCNIEGHA